MAAQNQTARALGGVLTVRRNLSRYKYLYWMALPMMAYYIIFCCLPLHGILLAFKDFNLSLGILGSPWAANPLTYFEQAFSDKNLWRAFNNTAIIGLMKLAFAFPAPIIIALLLNELQNKYFKRTIQTVIYLPRFVSWVIVSGLMVNLFSQDYGVVNQMKVLVFGGKPHGFLTDDALFRWLLVITEIWKGAGFGSIIYLSAITAINPEINEAAIVDGANKWQQIWNVTLPGILPTVLVMLILQVGSILNANFEQVYALYNKMVYSTGDILDTYVYRLGLQGGRYSFSTAVGLFKSVISAAFLLTTNFIVKRCGEDGLI